MTEALSYSHYYPHTIFINLDEDITHLKSALKATFEFAQLNGFKITLDDSINKLPNYTSDCVWSVRHKKDPKTDLRIKLLAMANQTQDNIGDEILISMQ